MDRRKQLKEEYKRMIPPMGVYQVKNTENGKFFIGHSMNLNGNRNSYPIRLEFESHHHELLHEDLKHHGIGVFVFEILETIDPEEVPQGLWRDTVSKLEDKWLEKLQPYGERGYNKPKRR